MSKDFDTIVIGSGPGGMNSAKDLAKGGQKVAIVEKDLWGGTCPNRGCDPKKILVAAMEAKNKVHQLQGKAFSEEAQINWPDLMAFKESYISSTPEASKKGLESAGAKTIKGEAKFLDAQTISVNDEEYTAEQFIIATGAKPSIIPIEGKEHFLTSDDFLSLEEMPEKISFVGGGFIAFEFAAIASAAGAEVHIVHEDERPLAAFDKELVDTVIEQLESKGVTFHYNILSEKIEKENDSYLLTDGDGFSLRSDLVFCSTGRVPNLDGLNLKELGVDYNKKGIEVDDHLQTSVESIYACGDVISKTDKKLTPISQHEAHYLASYLLGDRKETIDYPTLPTTVFTSPKMAQTGISPADASEDKYEVNTIDASGWFSYKHQNEAVSKIKTVIDRETGLLVGASCVNEEAETVINYLTLLIDKKVSEDEVKDQVMVFPTLGSDLASIYSAT
ncbi:MAG: NAD(P)/FAD-dependent oxidoreductase [Atopostipes sp.]|nr:NAD(P)/FAD-dependent oxidoreductase [Atopostipes sp.]